MDNRNGSIFGLVNPSYAASDPGMKVACKYAAMAESAGSHSSRICVASTPALFFVRSYHCQLPEPASPALTCD